MPTSNVEIPTPAGTADAYLSKPDDGQHPGVLFVMDALGLRPVIAEMTERIAARGYTVLAPNVFYRAGRAPVIPLPDLSDPDARGPFFQQLRPLIEQVTPVAIEQDGKAYLDYLAGVASEPVAITGYCMGARVALRIAATYPDRVAAVAGFHGGGLVTDEPDSPHLLADSIQAEVYFGHADNDQSNSPEQIAALDQALEDAGVTYRSDVYEGAAHGYTMSDMPVYDEQAGERHFRELFKLLEGTLHARV
jgi:carboxymethylenebutenolidase